MVFYQVPHTPKEAIELDKKNDNTKWQDSMALELLQLMECQTFQDLGGQGAKAPSRYKHIQYHVFYVKHDGRHKS